jgi:hypothetical protein
MEATDGLAFLEHSTAVIDWIDNSDYALNSKKLYYIALVSTLKANNLFPEALAAYKVRMDDLNLQSITIMKDQSLSPAEQHKYMEWPDILEAYERIRLAVCDLQTFQEYLIVSLYILVPPERLDYASMRIVSEEPLEHGANYLVWGDKPYFLMTNYKTYKKYGARRSPPLPKALCDIIKEWRSMVDDEYLLIAPDGRPMPEWLLGQTIISVFEKYTGKKVGANILRHSYASWMRKGELSFKESAALAQAMGHSQAMSALYRKI